MSPRHHIDPAQLVPTPDSNVTVVADFEDKVLSGLAAAIAFRCAGLVANDDPVTSPGRSVDLMELRADDPITERANERDPDRHEAARLSLKQMEAAIGKPGGPIGVVWPIRERGRETFREQYARAHRRGPLYWYRCWRW